MPPDPVSLRVVAHGGVALRLASDGLSRPDPAFPLLLGAYLPGASLVDWFDRCIDGVVEHTEGTPPAARVETREHVRIRDAWRGGVGADAYHLLYAMARDAWVRRGMFPAHAACVETAPGEGVLLAGHSGSGKTTLMLDLLRRGARMLSGNKTVLTVGADGLLASGGTATVTLPSSGARAADGLLEGGAVHYGDRVAGALRADLRSAAGALRIRKVLFLRVNDFPGEREALGMPGALHAVHPLMLDRVNASVILAGGADVYPDFCDADAQRRLARSLAAVLPGVEVVRASGSRAFLADEVMP